MKKLHSLVIRSILIASITAFIGLSTGQQLSAQPGPMPGPINGPLPPTAPSEIRGIVGDWIEVRADAVGPVRFQSADKGLKVFPSHLLREGKYTIVSAIRPGRYRLFCWTAQGGEPSSATEIVVIIDPEQPEPGPGPSPPGPKPPEPIVPDDQAIGEYWKLFQSDTSMLGNRRETLAKLLGFYRAIESHVQKMGAATVGDFRSDWESTQSEILGDIGQSLIEIRRLIAGKMRTTLGTDPDRKLDDVRANAVKEIREIIRCLDAVSKMADKAERKKS